MTSGGRRLAPRERQGLAESASDPVHEGRLFAHQPEAETGGRRAGCAAAGTRIANEVGDIGAMGALGDANAAIGMPLHGAALLVEGATLEAGRSPFPDIAREVQKSVLVD